MKEKKLRYTWVWMWDCFAIEKLITLAALGVVLTNSLHCARKGNVFAIFQGDDMWQYNYYLICLDA